MEYLIDLCPAEEEAASWQVEKQVWNPFNWEAHGSVGVDYFPELHFCAWDQSGRMVATIDAVPLDWDGKTENLPHRGFTEVVERAAEIAAERDLAREHGSDPPPPLPYACALGASILEAHRSSGLAGDLLKALRDQALRLGFKALLAPVRPSFRWRMPQTSIEAYQAMRLPDGRHFDPWVRVHERIGGRILGSCSASAVFEADRSAWERWSGISLPENGQVLFDGASGPVVLEEGIGRLEEDSLWILHPGSAS